APRAGTASCSADCTSSASASASATTSAATATAHCQRQRLGEEQQRGSRCDSRQPSWCCASHRSSPLTDLDETNVPGPVSSKSRSRYGRAKGCDGNTRCGGARAPRTWPVTDGMDPGAACTAIEQWRAQISSRQQNRA